MGVLRGLSFGVVPLGALALVGCSGHDSGDEATRKMGARRDAAPIVDASPAGGDADNAPLEAPADGGAGEFAAQDDAGTPSPQEEQKDGGSGPFLPRCAEAVPGTAVLFDRDRSLAGGEDFFAFPWPEQSRGHAELRGFPNPSAARGCEASVSGGLVGQVVGAISPPEYRAYVSALAALEPDGASPTGAIYFAFDGGLSAQLPTPDATLDINASPVLLINVDPDSPAWGRPVPIRVRVFERSLYLPEHTLALQPVAGFPLEPASRYAAVVRRGLRDVSGQPLGVPAALEAAKQGKDCGESDYTSVLALLESELDLAVGDVAAMTVFETADPAHRLAAVQASLARASETPALAAVSVSVDEVLADGSHLLEGTFTTPIHQRGKPPYLPQIDLGLSGSVAVRFDATDLAGDFLDEGAWRGDDGGQEQPRSERIQFRLAVPTSAYDGAATPVVVFAPGTGGGLESPFDSGIADELLGEGMALFVAESVMHGNRAHVEGIDPELVGVLALSDQLTGSSYVAELEQVVQSGDLFFNPLNLRAARGNSMQAALDYVWQSSLLSGFEIPGAGLGFSGVAFMGHSQGASVGPLTGPSVATAYVLSGASGSIKDLLLDKTLPADRVTTSNMLRYVTCDPAEELDTLHPLVSLLGQVLEPIEGVLHAPRLAAVPERAIFAMAGLQDHYSPPSSQQALMAALPLPQAAPALELSLQQQLIGQLHEGPLGVVEAPLSGNWFGVTRGFRQYVGGAGCSDDHFAYTCNEAARGDWRAFLVGWAAGEALVP